MSFLFSRLMAKKLQELDQEEAIYPSFSRPIFHDLAYCVELFDYEVKRYLGLGYLFSFIPGTDAYRARTILHEQNNEIIPILIHRFNTSRFNTKTIHFPDMHGFYKASIYASLRGSMFEFLILEPIWRLCYEAATFHTTYMYRGPRLSLKEIFFSLPLLSLFSMQREEFNHHEYIQRGYDGCMSYSRYLGLENYERNYQLSASKTIGKNLLDRLWNPFLFVCDFIIFLQKLYYSIAKRESAKDTYLYFYKPVDPSYISSPQDNPRRSILFLFWFNINVFLGILAMITNIPRKLITAAVQLTLFFLSSLKQIFCGQNRIIMKPNTPNQFSLIKKQITDKNSQISNKKNAFKQGKASKPALTAVKGCNDLTNLIFEFAFSKRQTKDACPSLDPLYNFSLTDESIGSYLNYDLLLFKTQKDHTRRRIISNIEQEMPEQKRNQIITNILCPGA